jgi:hypothetical protein
VAGYDLTYEISRGAAGGTKAWLTFFRRTATSLHLDVSYRLKSSGRSIRVRITIDGPLIMIQHLDRRLGNEVFSFLKGRGFNRRILDGVLSPFLREHKKGALRAAQAIQESTALLQSRGATVRTRPLTVSAAFHKRSWLRRPRSREDRAVAAISQAIDGWLRGVLSRERVAILADQTMEEWLKAICIVPEKSRMGFVDVLKTALGNDLVTQMEAYRLRTYHRIRNRVQHRGGRLSEGTLMNMLDYYVKRMNNRIGNAS